MPLSSKHLDRLEKDLNVHEDRISELRKQAAMLAEEISVHDWIVRLGRDPKVRKVLGDLADSAKTAEAMTGKEAEIISRNGIELPPNSTVSVTNDAGSVTVLLEAMHGKMPFALKWNSKAGFSSGPDRRSF
jgi:hypothetical protein